MNTRPIMPWLLLMALALPACAAKKPPEGAVISAALDTIDACYHWAEEVGGGGDEERASAIEEGFNRDCPSAQIKAREAHALYPGNQALALGLLKLNDLGYFELSEDEKQALCLDYSMLAKKKFLDSRVKDEYFAGFCPAQASMVYER